MSRDEELEDIKDRLSIVESKLSDPAKRVTLTEGHTTQPCACGMFLVHEDWDEYVSPTDGGEHLALAAAEILARRATA